MAVPAARARYFLHTDAVMDHVDRRHLRHGDVAERIGISRAYWSQLVHRHRPVTPSLRARLLASRVFRGLRERDLWERIEGGAS